MPWVGPQLQAVGGVAAAGDELLRQGLLPLMTAVQDTSIDAIKPVDGRIDTAALSALVGPAEQAAQRAANASATMNAVNNEALIGAVSSSVDRATEVFAESASALGALSRATQLLPDIMGQNGPRTYLVLVQNNAELRSLGGIAGSSILLRTDDGAISLDATRSGTSLSQGLGSPVVDLPDDIENLYGTRPARYFQNLTQIPDFTIDGPLAREMYKVKTGIEVDGVFTIDPVVLSYLLRATGPVTLPDGQVLTSDNAVSALLSEAYAKYSPSEQDTFFAQAAGTIFSSFLQGHASTFELLSALSTAVGERRILAWSADPAEQSLLAGSPIAGELPSTDDSTARFGVYLNDGAGSKMSYYVKPDVSVSWSGCAPPGRGSMRQLTLTLRLTNTAPADAATSLPRYVTGGGAHGVAPGTAAVVGNIYLPQGSQLVSAQATNGGSFTPATLEGREVLTYGLNLTPQSEETVTVVVETGSSARDAEAIVTPTADSSIDPIVATVCDVRSGAPLQ